jgi:hypothetical protein
MKKALTRFSRNTAEKVLQILRSLPHRRRRVFSFFDFRSSFSRFSDFIEASRVKKSINQKITSSVVHHFGVMNQRCMPT